MLMFSSFNVNHVYFFSLVHYHANMLFFSEADGNLINLVYLVINQSFSKEHK